MSHCSEPQDGRTAAEFLNQFRQQFGFNRKPGSREWPGGRLDGSDDGKFQMGVRVIDGRVVIAFDRPMDWIGMTPQEASDLAETLTIRGLEARGIK